jgi:hypothetical protein
MLEYCQAKKVHASLRPGLHYLTRLKDRMERTGRHKGKLYDLVCRARTAVFELSIEVHCDAQRGRKPR